MAEDVDIEVDDVGSLRSLALMVIQRGFRVYQAVLNHRLERFVLDGKMKLLLLTDIFLRTQTWDDA